MKWIKEKMKKEEGYTFLEVAIAFTVLFMLSAMMTVVVRSSTDEVDLREAQSNLRTYQGAVVLFYAHHERTPNNEELYCTFLKGQKKLGFKTISAKDFKDNLELLRPKATESSPIADLMDVDEQEFIEMPEKWIIISTGNLANAEFIYVVDDRVAVIVPNGKPPFDHEAAMNIESTDDSEEDLIL